VTNVQHTLHATIKEQKGITIFFPFSYSAPKDLISTVHLISHHINVLLITIIIITYRVAHPTNKVSAAISATNAGY